MVSTLQEVVSGAERMPTLYVVGGWYDSTLRLPISRVRWVLYFTVGLYGAALVKDEHARASTTLLSILPKENIIAG